MECGNKEFVKKFYLRPIITLTAKEWLDIYQIEAKVSGSNDLEKKLHHAPGISFSLFTALTEEAEYRWT